MKNILTLVSAALLALSVCSTPLFAKGGGGFSSSSSGGSRSSSSSSSSKSYSSPKPSSSAPKQSSWSSSSQKSSSAPASKPSTAQAQTSTRAVSKVEAARYQDAAKSGKAFTTRESAVADFKTKNANTYTSKYASEPAKRPDYIPQSYNSGGTSHTIVYNQGSGGYGYWGGGGPGLGTFILYDAMSDAVMMNTLMSRQNYYVGEPVHHAPLGWIWQTLFGILAISFIGFVAYKLIF